MTLQEIYNEMKRRKLVATKEGFSQWMAMSPSYFGVMGNRSTLEAMMALWTNLQGVGEMDLAAQVFSLIRGRIDRRPHEVPSQRVAAQ